jgi:hypothetical protein
LLFDPYFRRLQDGTNNHGRFRRLLADAKSNFSSQTVEFFQCKKTTAKDSPLISSGFSSKKPPQWLAIVKYQGAKKPPQNPFPAAFLTFLAAANAKNSCSAFVTSIKNRVYTMPRLLSVWQTDGKDHF